MSRKRILLIDNDQFSLSVLYRLVTELGYEPLIASTFDAAETLIEGQTLDIVIYNQDLESEWGVSVLDRLRRSSTTGSLPLVLLSQSASRYAPRVADNGESTYCFQKPIAIEPFIDLVKELAGDRTEAAARR